MQSLNTVVSGWAFSLRRRKGGGGRGGRSEGGGVDLQGRMGEGERNSEISLILMYILNIYAIYEIMIQFRYVLHKQSSPLLAGKYINKIPPLPPVVL